MPRTDFGDGLTWWAHTRVVAEEAITEENLASTPVLTRAVSTTDPYQARDPLTGDFISPVTNTRGETPGVMLLPAIQAYVYVAGGELYLSTTNELVDFEAKVSALAAAAEEAAASAALAASSLDSITAAAAESAEAATAAAAAAAQSAEDAASAAALATTFPKVTTLAQAAAYPVGSVVVARNPPV